jgi:hypothetical protein
MDVIRGKWLSKNPNSPQIEDLVRSLEPISFSSTLPIIPNWT